MMFLRVSIGPGVLRDLLLAKGVMGEYLLFINNTSTEMPSSA